MLWIPFLEALSALTEVAIQKHAKDIYVLPLVVPIISLILIL
jgi:hypothetical protein